MRIVIFGGTGLVGRALAGFLTENNHEVLIGSRTPKQANEFKWEPNSPTSIPITDCDVVINLAGTSLNSGRWTSTRKVQILESRILSTKSIVDWIATLSKRPHTFINASAVGIYPTKTDTIFTDETVAPFQSSFLADVVKQWEDVAFTAENFGVRTITARFGVILSSKGGAWKSIKMPYSLYIGGPVASGKQPLPWIHIDDVCSAMEFCIQNTAIDGPVNFVAPALDCNESFGLTLSKIMNRPHFLRTPTFALSLVLGEMHTLITEGQFVLPSKLLANGYSFLRPTTFDAVKELCTV
ncbi:MAG: TIGR01777 family oxidoreductase [Bacilli bacterium]